MKLVIYIAQTLNGLIAKKDGSTPWSDESWESYQNICTGHPAIIVGRKTFEAIEEDVSEWDSIGSPFVIVISSKPLSLREGLIQASSPEAAVKALEARGFKSAIIGGGAKTNSAFLSARLVNEVIVDVESQMFVSGIPFLNLSIIKNDIKLKLVSAKKISENLAQLRYLVKGVV